MTEIIIPLFQLDRVYHIGTLDPADQGRNSGGSSLEGRCLSVSLCPKAWQQIARLGGYPLHEFRKEGGTFVDMHALERNGSLADILDWARNEGLIRDAILWKSWTWDDEWECWRSQLFESRGEAVEEADPDGRYDVDDDIPGPDGRPAVEEVSVPVGNERLARITGARTRPDEDVTDFVLLAFAMERSGADGAWWDEDYDLVRLSAPRGAIFPSRVGEWHAFPAEWHRVEDEREVRIGPSPQSGL